MRGHRISLNLRPLGKPGAGTLPMVLVVALAGCAPATGLPTSEPQVRPSSQRPSQADELLVVDCLLPGQIRRLGQRLVTLTPRRPIKTSARDCEIRGGEYVAWDRATYETALKVWMPLASEGDPAAQTYVGEIYERGLGVPPDYAKASDWYRRAADGGSARAAVNLGYLYEQGLGVPQDTAQAAHWYRKATGAAGPSLVVEAAARPDGERTPPERAPASHGGPTIELTEPESVKSPAAGASGRSAGVPAIPGLNRYHALVIGNEDYRLLPPLGDTVAGARSVAEILNDDYEFKVTLLTNASRYDILGALNDLRQRLTHHDSLLIFYGGRGQMDRDGGVAFWLPVDAEPANPATWISSRALTDFLGAMNVRQVLVATDSCYAGTLGSGSLTSPAKLDDQERLAVVQDLAQRRSRMLMAPGACEPASGAGDRPSSFARSLADILRANREALSGQELFRLLRVRLATMEQPPTTQRLQYAPIRHAGHEGGDFVFVRAVRN